MHRFIAATLALSVGAVGPAMEAAAQFEDQSVQFFLASDTDGDELLTLSEFRSFIGMMANAGAVMSQRIEQFAAYRVAFRRVDANGDGFASPDELRAAESSN